jgi:hypothetical protein
VNDERDPKRRDNLPAGVRLLAAWLTASQEERVEFLAHVLTLRRFTWPDEAVVAQKIQELERLQLEQHRLEMEHMEPPERLKYLERLQQQRRKRLERMERVRELSNRPSDDKPK